MINNLNILLPEIFLTISIFSVLMIGVFIKNSFNLIFNLSSISNPADVQRISVRFAEAAAPLGMQSTCGRLRGSKRGKGQEEWSQDAWNGVRTSEFELPEAPTDGKSRSIGPADVPEPPKSRNIGPAGRL